MSSSNTRSSDKKGVLLCGYYGQGNAGDEAVLAASVSMLRQRRPSLPITAMSGSPRQTAQSLNISAIPRMNPVALSMALRRTGLFLLGGGSLLQDTTSARSLLYYLGMLNFARRHGVKTMIFAQGVGPLLRPESRQRVTNALATVHAVTVRDAESAELLETLGIGSNLGTGTGPTVDVTADPVFALAPEVTERVNAAAAERPVVAVSLRPWPGVERLYTPLAEALRAVTIEARVQCWPLQPATDTGPCAQLAAAVPGATVAPGDLSPTEWMALAGWSDVVVGMRLHALIFGAARAVPVVGVSYDPKIDALLARLRGRAIGRVGPNEAPIEAKALQSAIQAALDEGETRRRDREARAEHLRDAAFRNADRALALLDR